MRAFTLHNENAAVRAKDSGVCNFVGKTIIEKDVNDVQILPFDSEFNPVL